MASYDTIIRNAEVMTPDGLQAVDVAIAGGQIAALLPRGDGEATHTIDATGQHLLPGAIDIHFHIRAPAYPDRGTVESETRAAAAGGITTLFEMPISKPCCTTPISSSSTHPSAAVQGRPAAPTRATSPWNTSRWARYRRLVSSPEQRRSPSNDG